MATRSSEGDFPALERIIWCGEVLPPAVLLHWMERVPEPSYTNLYGPTEATIASSYYTVAGATAAIRARRSRSDCHAPARRSLVLDGQLEAVAAGEIGELYIAGAG